MRVFPILLTLVSFPAAASDFGPGLLFVMVGVVVAFVWPLLLPFFYLRGARNKAKLYLALVLTAYGLVALLSVPFQILALVGSSFSDNLLLGPLYLSQPLAFATSLWALPKVKRLLAQPPVAL
jgi:hypothetical protein